MNFKLSFLLLYMDLPPLKSPLRYPGGKSKALKTLLPLIPAFQEYREPFLGGGSMLIALKQLRPKRKFWGNDLNYDLYSFWKTLQTNALELTGAVTNIRKNSDGAGLFTFYQSHKGASVFEKAVRFFVCNRISFSGLTDSGGFSPHAFKHRFTPSSIERLLSLSPLLQTCKFSHGSYSSLLTAPGKGIFIFLDPPYYQAESKRLYGKKGDLHLGFDHDALANELKTCKHDFLLTYDDCPEIRALYSWAHVYSWSLQYGMNNCGHEKASKGQEILVTNSPMTSLGLNTSEHTLFDCLHPN